VVHAENVALQQTGHIFFILPLREALGPCCSRKVLLRVTQAMGGAYTSLPCEVA